MKTTFPREEVDTLIIGAGLAGLSAAVRLHEAGRSFLVLEAEGTAGGRVRTDRVDGFLIDRGFQVYLDAYPESGSLLELPDLDLRRFDPGAFVWKGGHQVLLMDAIRRPSRLYSSLRAPVGGLADKWKTLLLRERFRRMPVDEIWGMPEESTLSFLRREGFSREMIDLFFRGFYGGVFLEDGLETSSRMFAFTFAMFSRGSATLPARGMQAIPDQLVSRLPPDRLRLSSPVLEIRGTTARLEGEEISARNLLLATQASQTARFLGSPPSVSFRQTTCLSFAAERAPYKEPLITLKGDRKGLIHHLSVPSNVAPSYAPEGQALVSVTLLGDHGDEARLEKPVRKELSEWFGKETDSWKLLRVDRIREALPSICPIPPLSQKVAENVFIAGDFTRSASIEGAIGSGLRVAERILNETG